jgi:two-component system chemotaxis sensor kinase CheA
MIVEIADDGRGMNEEAIRRTAIEKHLVSEKEISALSREQLYNLIFLPTFSTTPLITDLSGRGVGLDVVRTNVERLKGVISVHSEPGRGSTFRIEAPITLATTRVLLVQIGQRSYAIPMEAVQETFIVSPTSIFAMGGRPSMQWATMPVPVERLADLLELPTDRTANKIPKAISLPGVLLAIGAERLGLFVDALLDEQEVVLKPFEGLLNRVRNVLGSTILSNGEICMVLNPSDLMKSMHGTRRAAPRAEAVEEERKKVLLLAEDSITTRTQEKRILEGAGYEVVTAVDGADAFSKLSTRDFDAVVTDIEMPNMTGLQLAERIRRDAKYKELPIILVTSLASDEDRQRGVEVGANAYITKGNFEQRLLLDTLRRLV